MVKQRMDLLELLRKRGMDGDVDFLREALRVLVDGIMDAEVSAQIGAQHGERSPERAPTATATATAPGTPGWAPWRCTFPSCGKAATSPACWNHGGASRKPCWPSSSKPTLRQAQDRRGGRVHSAGGRSDQGPGLRRHLQQPGVAHLRATGRSGGEFPGSAPGRWSLPLRVVGRPDPEGSGGRSHRERLRGGGDGGQCRWAA